MAKRTAVIDLGSNSFRLVIFERTSRFGFVVVKEVKSFVRIGEGSDANGSQLLQANIDKAVGVLKSFSAIIKSLKAKKTLCVATSAIRDASNQNLFKKEVLKATGIKIKTISGEREGHLGAIAVMNLLPMSNFITMDIGGGSTEMVLVKDKQIIDSLSLDIGAVRLRHILNDLSLHKPKNLDKAQKFVSTFIDKIPNTYYGYPLIAIGGTARSIAKIITYRSVPMGSIHGFTFDRKELHNTYGDLIKADDRGLEMMRVAKDRRPYIKMGGLIFDQVAKSLNTSQIVISGVGIREGLFLSDILRHQHHKFPINFHIGMCQLKDQFIHDEKLLKLSCQSAYKLFDLLSKPFNIDDKYRIYLKYAIYLLQASATINSYKKNEYASHFILNNRIYNLMFVDKVISLQYAQILRQKTIQKKRLSSATTQLWQLFTRL